jgi:WD40 repeat protein
LQIVGLRKVVAGFRDSVVKEFDLESGRELRSWKEHAGSVLCLQVDEHREIDGKGKGALVSGGSDGTVVFIELEGGRKFRTLTVFSRSGIPSGCSFTDSTIPLKGPHGFCFGIEVRGHYLGDLL